MKKLLPHFQQLKKLIKEKGYHPKQVFDCNKTRLFLKMSNRFEQRPHSHNSYYSIYSYNRSIVLLLVSYCTLIYKLNFISMYVYKKKVQVGLSIIHGFSHPLKGLGMCLLQLRAGLLQIRDYLRYVFLCKFWQFAPLKEWPSFT